MKKLPGTILAALFLSGIAHAQKTTERKDPHPIDPPTYFCHRAPTQVAIDGDIDGKEWSRIPWTSDFVDIQGANRPVTPRFRTRAKLMWDDTCLYIAAELEEPHLWATLTERESVIFQNNDFEVFLDVRGDGELYMEYEVNALGTEWDLMLTKAYSKGGIALNAWNFNGLKSAVKLYGTLNDPGDTDQRWTVEMAIPLKTLTEVKGRTGKVKEGDTWRFNFSRVQWELDRVDGKYVKRAKSSEDNWVLAPTGKINIHMPEYWGYLKFAGEIRE